MRREDEFVVSHRPYAVDLSSLTVEPHQPGERTVYYCWVSAVWYRRRNGQTVACVGTLRGFQHAVPSDALEFLARHDDGRYGGDCLGRWDGARYWGAQEPETIEQHLALLRPMLDAYPAVPAGYDGWWTFHDGSR